MATAAPDPSSVSQLLSECVVRVGAVTDLTPRRAAAMTCGDRDHLLLQLRAAALGPVLRLAVRCPSPSCLRAGTLSLETAALCAVPAADPPASLSAETPAGRALLRELTGEDAAALVGLAPGERSAHTWSRAVLRLGERGAMSAREWRALPTPVRHAIAIAYDRQRRGPRLAGHQSCTHCGALIPWEATAASLLAAGLRPGAERLAEEVHAFAWHYGWSEAETLALPRQRRWTYLRRLRLAVESA